MYNNGGGHKFSEFACLSDDFVILSGVPSAFGSRSGPTFKNVRPDMGPNGLHVFWQTTPAGKKLKQFNTNFTDF